MGTEREDGIQNVLAALGRAELPEGLEARIADGLQRRAAEAEARAVRIVEFGWRDLVRGSAVARVWWRGAACGSAIAIVSMAAVMLAGHFARGSAGMGGQVPVAVSGDAGKANGSAAALSSDHGASVLVSEAREKPCAGAGVMRAGVVRAPAPRMVRAKIVERVAEPGLTAQERDLVRLARRVDPQALALLNPELRARLNAEDAAEFEKFFAPPPKPSTTAITNDK